MTTRMREAALFLAEEDIQHALEALADSLSPMSGCPYCQADFEGGAAGRHCPACGGPLSDYDRRDMLEIASERL